jgi:uncharacterized SAM-binding protein YcdF (DUF218 family)
MSITPGRKRWSILAIGLLAALIVFGANAGRILVADAPQHSDLILVLAGETDARPALALDLLHRGYAPGVVMDVPAEGKIYDTTTLQIAERFVSKLPEQAQVLICAIRGLSTRDEAHDVARCLANENGLRILIVTSDYHTGRALSIFRHEMPGHYFSVAGAHDETQFGVRWWRHRQWAKTCVDEWLRVLWWNAVERWR